MRVKRTKTKNPDSLQLLLEAIRSIVSFKKKKRPTIQRMEEPMTLNEFDINAAVTELRSKQRPQQPGIV
jgi:hypothetical protein